MNLLEAETEEVKNIIVIKIHRLKAWFTFAVDLPKIPTWRLELKMRNTFSATSASSDITVDILRPKAFEETSKLHQPCTKPQLLRSFQINKIEQTFVKLFARLSQPWRYGRGICRDWSSEFPWSFRISIWSPEFHHRSRTSTNHQRSVTQTARCQVMGFARICTSCLEQDFITARICEKCDFVICLPKRESVWCLEFLKGLRCSWRGICSGRCDSTWRNWIHRTVQQLTTEPSKFDLWHSIWWDFERCKFAEWTSEFDLWT